MCSNWDWDPKYHPEHSIGGKKRENKARNTIVVLTLEVKFFFILEKLLQAP